MNVRFAGLCLAMLAGAGSLLAPADAEAGNVGYYAACTGLNINPAGAITLAGHTPISVTTLDAASLAPLDALVIAQCGPAYAGSTAVDDAVSNGLRVMIDSQYPPAANALPGDPALVLDTTGQCALDVSITPGAPVASGPGGALTDSSLDTHYLCSPMGSVLASTLPAGGQSLVEIPSLPGRSAAVAYPTGSGLVALSISQWMFTLPGGGYEGDALAPGALTYYANTIAWLVNAEIAPTTTCASEGYTGTKLSWCKIICESESSSSTIDTYLRRWINRYHDLPYCAVD